MSPEVTFRLAFQGSSLNSKPRHMVFPRLQLSSVSQPCARRPRPSFRIAHVRIWEEIIGDLAGSAERVYAGVRARRGASLTASERSGETGPVVRSKIRPTAAFYACQVAW